MKIKPAKRSLKLYDAAILPPFLQIYGESLLIILAVLILVFYAGKLIRNARARNQEMLDRQARLDALAIEEDWAKRVQSRNVSKPTIPVDVASPTGDADKSD